MTDRERTIADETPAERITHGAPGLRRIPGADRAEHASVLPLYGSEVGPLLGPGRELEPDALPRDHEASEELEEAHEVRVAGRRGDRAMAPGPFERSGAVLEPTGMPGAARAAIDLASGLDPMPDDPAPAMRAGRRHRMYGALETVESHRAPLLRYLERLVYSFPQTSHFAIAPSFPEVNNRRET